MAHNINEDRVFTVGKAWHNIGTVVETEQTAQEAIKLAKLDYEVVKEPTEKVPSKFYVKRTDNGQYFDDIVGSNYQIIQNVDAFSFFDVVVGEGQAIYHSAGALGDGERIWLLAKLPNDIVINSEDVVEKYLCLTNAHTGKASLLMYFTPIRVVCENTLNWSMKDAKNGISIRHTGNIKNKVEEARRVLGLSINYYKLFEEMVVKMEDVPIQEKELNEYFDNVLGINDDEEVSTRKQNQKSDLIGLFDSGKGQKLGQKHSLWKAYNAVTEYVDHYRTVKNVVDNPSNKLASIWFGSGAKIKQKAYEEALVLVK